MKQNDQNMIDAPADAVADLRVNRISPLAGKRVGCLAYEGSSPCHQFWQSCCPGRTEVL